MEQVKLVRLERAIEKVAILIDQTGEDFWPILERLEAERDALISREVRLAKYLSQSAGSRGRQKRRNGRSLSSLVRRETPLLKREA
ncbi:hypothetical protein [Hyphococcus luteus]|uniref:hypothetical protein n=1 Tax=Hyphococcus luteus TaxID=2058213 RepID=UPI001057091A|nr:hypothetical protein [Marinicaulis flavus]